MTPRQGIGPIVAATVVTTDLDGTAARYTTGLGWRETRDRHPMRASRARILGTPGLAGMPTTELGSGAAGQPVVQLVEHPAAPRVAALRTYGWAALEFQVPDVHTAVRRAERAGFEVLNRPTVLQNVGRQMPLVAAQLAGRDGDTVYLTQIQGELPNFDLPRPTPFPEIFICVYATRDLAAARGAVETRFDVRRASDREVAIGVLNRQFGLPGNSMHRISSLQLQGRHAFEFDQYPSEAEPRPARAGVPACGILAVSVLGRDAHALAMADGGLLEVIPAA